MIPHIALMAVVAILIGAPLRFGRAWHRWSR